MSNINLHSVLEKLINEDMESAEKILHDFIVETCSDINKNLVNEEVHVHVHRDGGNKSSVVANEMDDEEEIDEKDEEPWDDGVGNWFKGTDQHGHPVPYDHESTDENLSPISGIQNMDDEDDIKMSKMDLNDEEEDMLPASDDMDGDLDSEMDPDMGGDLDGDMNTDMDDTGLEDRVDDLEDELADLKSQLKDMLDDDGADSSEVADDSSEDDAEKDDDSEDDDSEDDVEEADDEEEDDQPVSEDFSDLDESFELEKIADPHLDGSSSIGAKSEKFSRNDRSPLPQNAPDKRVGGNAIEIRAEEYSGVDRQPSPSVMMPPIRKNQVKRAADNLEAVDSMGPKSALLNKKDLFPATDEKSLIGSDNKLRGDFMKRK